jgi:hypothetical protein
MELTGIILQVFEEKEVNGISERIIRVKSHDRGQILDIYAYKKLVFKTGFLKQGEEFIFSIFLQGIEVGERQDTRIIIRKPIKPTLELTKDHPLVDVEWIRKDEYSPKNVRPDFT